MRSQREPSRATTNRVSTSLALACFLTLQGCASTTVETRGTALGEPLCAPGRVRPVAVFWLPQWRMDQKDRELREAAAQKGIEDFIAETTCLATTGAHRLLSVPSVEELRHTSSTAERVVLIVVRELGPRLVVGIPALVEGGTEVVLEVKVLDPRQAEPLASGRTRWRHGGMFYLRGVESLDKDMAAALRAALIPGGLQ